MKKNQTDPALVIAFGCGIATFAWLSHAPQAWPHVVIVYLAKMTGLAMTTLQNTMAGAGIATGLGLIPGFMVSDWDRRNKERAAARKAARELGAQDRERERLAQKTQAAMSSEAMVRRLHSQANPSANQFRFRDLTWMLPGLALIGAVFWYVII